mgnify:CR=1 FL=1
MIKYFESKKWLLEISNTEVSANVILHYKQNCLMNIRYGKLGIKYFSAEIFGRQLINF